MVCPSWEACNQTGTLSFYLMSVPSSPGRETLGIPVTLLSDLGKSTGHIMGELRVGTMVSKEFLILYNVLLSISFRN